jgi:hypothetical protein
VTGLWSVVLVVILLLMEVVIGWDASARPGDSNLNWVGHFHASRGFQLNWLRRFSASGDYN